MLSAVCAAAIVLIAGAAAAAEPRLVVVLASTEAIPEQTLEALRDETSRIFRYTPAEVDIQVLRGVLEVRGADEIIHIDVAGSCAPRPRLRRNPTKALAAMFGIDHQLQPIGKLDCAAVSQYLGPVSPTVFGRAMARVLAHELYHFLTQRRDHSADGLFAGGLSDLALTAPALDFSDRDLLLLNGRLEDIRKTSVQATQAGGM